jgi:ligand-binding sensor domain-containing protein
MQNTNQSIRIKTILLLITPWLAGCLFGAVQISDNQEPNGENETTPTQPPTPTPDPIWTYYRNEELHPTEDDANLVFDQQGYLWVTGYGGVIRWDLMSKTFMAYTQADGVSAANLRRLIIDSNNVPWIATDEEIQKFNGESWETFKKPTNGRTNDFAEGGDGKLWLCALDGIFSYEAGNWVRYGTHNGLISDHCYGMKIGLDGNPWVIARKNSLSHFSQGWINYEVTEDLFLENETIFDNGTFRNIHIAPNGDVWIDTVFSVVRFDGEDWYLYKLPEKEGLVTGFGLSSSGTPWLAQVYLSKAYFRAFNGYDWPVIMKPGYEGGLPTNSWPKAIAAPDGAIWFIGHDIFIRTMQNGWTVYPRAPEFYSGDFLTTVAFSPDGKMYYAGSEGILELGKNPDDFQVYGSAGQLADNYIRDIQFDPQGMMWVWQGKDTDFGVFGSLERFDGQRFETFTDRSMSWYLVARDGSLWVRANNAKNFLEWWDGNEWHGYGGDFGDVSDLQRAGLSWLRGVRNIVQDEQGQIWISYDYTNDYGVAMWDSVTWKKWPQPGIPDKLGGSYELKFSSDGVLWLTSDRFGASYLVNGTWRSIPISKNMLKDTVEDNYKNTLYPIQFNNLNQPILLFFDPREKYDPALFEMQGYSWSRVSIKGFVQTILYHANTFWVGTADNGLYYRQDSETAPGSEWIHLSVDDWQGGSQVSLVAAGKDDDVWVVTETGLALFDGTEWNYFPYGKHGITDVSIIKVAPDGTVWFGSTTQGLASYWSP